MKKTKTYKKSPQDLRWGFSTGASMSALALCAWHFLQAGQHLSKIPVYFLDECERLVPVLSQNEIEALKKTLPFSSSSETSQSPSLNTSYITALYKDGGDDPDCTHNALIYARLSKASPDNVGKDGVSKNDYILQINQASLIIKSIEGIGLCTRDGLDCEQGKWAITQGPRQMLIENLRRAKMQDGVWLLEIGVKQGELLAKNTLNPLLGVVGGISLLGTTGLVRPYSHEAYLHTIQTCVKAHALMCQKTQLQKTEVVFCTGGRTKKGVQAYFSLLPESAFILIGDFIAESLKIACQYSIHSITVACMAGKLCKYAAGFTNTHAHRVQQDMDLLRKEFRSYLAENPNNQISELCEALENAPSVREALLYIPEDLRIPLLKKLALKALRQFRSWCGNLPHLKLLVCDFTGVVLFEKECQGNKDAKALFDSIDLKRNTDSSHFEDLDEKPNCMDSKTLVERNYFINKTSFQRDSIGKGEKI